LTIQCFGSGSTLRMIRIHVASYLQKLVAILLWFFPS
jgi:hypothetical protein